MEQAHRGVRSVQFSSVTQSCPTLCDPMDCSTPGLPVHHQLPKFTQTHVHRVSEAIQPSHPLSSPSPSGTRESIGFNYIVLLYDSGKIISPPTLIGHQLVPPTNRGEGKTRCQLLLLGVYVSGSCVKGRPSMKRTELIGPQLIFSGNSGLKVLGPCAP